MRGDKVVDRFIPCGLLGPGASFGGFLLHPRPKTWPLQAPRHDSSTRPLASCPPGPPHRTAGSCYHQERNPHGARNPNPCRPRKTTPSPLELIELSPSLFSSVVYICIPSSIAIKEKHPKSALGSAV